MNNIYILWPTARQKDCSQAYMCWYNAARERRRLKTSFIVATGVDVFQPELFDLPKVVSVIQDGAQTGVCNALHVLCQACPAQDDDIVVVASDDIVPPANWDDLIISVLNSKRGMLWVNDGWHGDREIIAVPICDGATFKKLNKIIYHPSYHHLWSDNELFLNCKEMGLLVDARGQLTFEHKHYYAGKRQVDVIDRKIQGWQAEDRLNWERRSLLPLATRLCGVM